MSEQILRRAGRTMDLHATMPWLVTAGVYVLLIALGPQLLNDPDTYSHIALGRWILEHHVGRRAHRRTGKRRQQRLIFSW